VAEQVRPGNRGPWRDARQAKGLVYASSDDGLEFVAVECVSFADERSLLFDCAFDDFLSVDRG
jgi:hypothetical protein